MIMAPLKRILLAEDNEIGVEAMQDYLLAHHYRVIVARSGAEAIARTHAEHPDRSARNGGPRWAR